MLTALGQNTYQICCSVTSHGNRQTDRFAHRPQGSVSASNKLTEHLRSALNLPSGGHLKMLHLYPLVSQSASLSLLSSRTSSSPCFFHATVHPSPIGSQTFPPFPITRLPHPSTHLFTLPSSASSSVFGSNPTFPEPCQYRLAKQGPSTGRQL